MKLIAHRCGTDRYPELTLDAAGHSRKLGADYVEMDIRFTKDDFPVISHDADGEKLFGTSKNVCDMTLKEFKELKFVEEPEYHPHTLEEILASDVGPVLFHIKEGGERLSKILLYIRKFNCEDKVVMGVQYPEDVKRVKEFNADIKVLAFMQDKNVTDDFLKAGADVIRLWEEWVTKEKIEYIHEHGRQIWVMAGSSQKHTTGYTSPEALLTWKEWETDGVLVNEITKTLKILQEV